MNQVTKLNFKGHLIYVGIDVHLRSWKISIFTDEIEVETKSIEPSVKILSHYLRGMFPVQYITVHMKQDIADIGNMKN